MPRLTLNDHRIPTTYVQAAKILGDEDWVPIAHNTDLVSSPVDGAIGVRLHRTVVVWMLRDNTYSLWTGGYHTVTTKDRINRFTPPHIRVWQDDWEWFVRDRDGERPFEDGIVVR